MFIQATINILHLAILYFIIGQSFQILYAIRKYFNIAIAGLISLSSYIFYLFFNQLNIHWVFSGVLSIAICLIIYLSLEYLLIYIVQRRITNSLMMLVYSLGVYAIIEGLLSIVWGNSSLQLNLFTINQRFKILNGYIAISQAITIIFGLIFFVSTVLIFGTKAGIQIKAFSDNAGLAVILGTDLKRLLLIASS
ncbi:MAG TPA: hypothetical protein DCG75_17710, partial [Bacteroidales bacterium]|nr:hypothetical protein [Bacteroidales bacterium]